MALSPTLAFGLRYAAANYSRANPLRKISVELLKLHCGPRPKLPAGLSEVRPLDMPTLSFEPSSSMVIETAYWFGVRGYEGIVADVWRYLCRNSRSILEIGANVGLFTVIGAEESVHRYTAVEPIPEVAAILRANLLRNGITNVEVLEAAATPNANQTSVKLNIPNEGRDAPVGAHLIGQVEIAGRSTLRVIDVEGLSICQLMTDRDLVKIDAEGIEAELLYACMGQIAENKPTLVIEVLPEARGLGTLISQIARQVGYNLFIIPEYGSDSVVRVTPDSFSSTVPQKYKSKDIVLTTMPRII